MASTTRTPAPARTGGQGLPIFNLTLRSFTGGKAVRVVALFAFIPTLFGLIYWLDSGGIAVREFASDMFQELIAPTILPLAILALATTALGNELEDRTMAYLVLKPIPRWRIILEKFLAILVTCTLVLWIGTAVTWLVIVRGSAADNVDLLLSMLVGVFFAALGYGALFMTTSLFISRALLAGIIYSLLWETSLARFVPGIRLISVRHYVVSIYGRILDEPLFLVEQAMQLAPAIIVLVVLTVLSLVLGSWRLATMNLE